MNNGSVNKGSESNHGEGNPEAADRFNTTERAFVDSARGKKKIETGPQVRPEEEADLAKAERTGRAHSKDGHSDSASKSKA